MREKKFRAWDGRRMTTSGIMFNSSTGELVVPETINDPKMILMQYTGLKDKNGKDVFEGDIVIPSSYSVEDYPKKFFKDCVVNDLEWAFSNKSIFNEYKVVGNIYENPELLSE